MVFYFIGLLAVHFVCVSDMILVCVITISFQFEKTPVDQFFDESSLLTSGRCGSGMDLMLDNQACRDSDSALERNAVDLRENSLSPSHSDSLDEVIFCGEQGPLLPERITVKSESPDKPRVAILSPTKSSHYAIVSPTYINPSQSSETPPLSLTPSNNGVSTPMKSPTTIKPVKSLSVTPVKSPVSSTSTPVNPQVKNSISTSSMKGSEVVPAAIDFKKKSPTLKSPVTPQKSLSPLSPKFAPNSMNIEDRLVSNALLSKSDVKPKISISKLTPSKANSLKNSRLNRENAACDSTLLPKATECSPPYVPCVCNNLECEPRHGANTCTSEREAPLTTTKDHSVSCKDDSPVVEHSSTEDNAIMPYESTNKMKKNKHLAIKHHRKR